MATPLRFRRSDERWTGGRVRSDLYAALDANIGATMDTPWYRQPEGYDARRFDMDNGDVALFVWDDNRGYWMGNTETPRALWDTEKYTFTEVADPIAEWAERELLAHLHEEAPWLEAYPHISTFFLPVLLSKDGRHTTREFFYEHAAGFPHSSREAGLSYYEEFLATDPFDDRYVMAAKLGTAKQLDLTRMSAAMSEFTVAKLLLDAGYDVTPEIDVTTGHAIDFRADRDGTGHLVEVTRPLAPSDRSAGSAVKSIRETVQTKTSGQLQRHGGGVTLFVDCSSFDDGEWQALRADRPDVGHRPAVVFRVCPGEETAAYPIGSVPIDLPSSVTDA
ncbi:hypothetical protein Hrd1104_04380 [Halorhabdus sp. CBA1104]|uniref:DUF5784 family protein n=1 Tax=Halorhabdus sp. CBA1104 TaxID=1380432 RepID=UPI0012B2D990|nr:DUF5784 family protein [Halorhabdus sp. CBA1104]QGN06608.1 hypothetical protein Hrd1104_04380 [Halorhabdus sp. CBA1104]